MAVNGELLVYPGQELTPQDFAIMMERISVIKSGILSGCTIAFSETDYNTLNVSEGYLFIKGRLVKVMDGTLDVSTLSRSVETWYVYAELHLDSELILEDPVSIYVSDTTPRNADSEDFNVNNSGYATTVLAVIARASRTVSQVTAPEIGTIETFTLGKNNWAYINGGSNNEYRVLAISLIDSRFTNDAHIEIVPCEVGFNYPYLLNLQQANIQVHSIGNGVLTLGCYGFKPTMDLEIGIVFRGSL